MLTREEALRLVRSNVAKENNVRHMIAVGGVMKETAVRLGEDDQTWEVVGILHDIDLEVCCGISDHTIKARELLNGQVDEDLIKTIMAHNHEYTNVPVDTKIKRGLICCDAVSGLVLACALVMPSKKLMDVKVESIVKKFGSKDFAKGVSRERISLCQEIDIPLNEFLGVALEGMRKVSDELGL